MDIQNNNVSIQINAKDLSGKQLRVADCDVFIVHVFTDDPKFYLVFSKRDMLMTEFVDELVIPKHQMEQLGSGVVQYTYHYLPVNHDCVLEKEEDDKVEEIGMYHPHHHHGHGPENLINSKAVITSIYWRNIKHPHPVHPANAVSLFDIERLHRLIENERVAREKDIVMLQSQFGVEFDAKVDAEIERSTTEDEKINAEIEAIKSSISDANDAANEAAEKVNADIAENATDIANEFNRASQKEIELEQLIQGEVSRAKGAEEVIDTRIVMEKERAQTNEANINDRVVSVTDRFDAFKTLSTENLNTEVARAKSVESSLNDRISGVVSDLSAEISRAAQKDIEHTNLVETEANRAKAVENKIATDLATEITRAKDAEKHILDEVHTVQGDVAKLATANDVYTKSEVDTKISGVKNDVSTVQNWINNHSDNTDELKAKVSSLVSDTADLTTNLANEINARELADASINAKVTVVDGKVDAENERAKASEKILSDTLNEHKTYTNSKYVEIADSVADVAANLTLETARAKAAEKVNADAIAVITADASTHGSIKKSLADAKDYTDIEIAKLSLAKNVEIADTLAVYAKKSDVDTAIQNVVGTAPAALDTLGEIANLLSQDSDAITAINGVLSGKANSDDVYTKTEVDTAITGVNNSISTLETKVNNADVTINNRIDDVNTKIAGIELNIAADSSALANALADEINRAKSAEKANADKIADEVDKLTVKISDVNAALIEDIAKSDAKDIELDAKIDANSAAIASEIARSKQVDTELNDKINNNLIDAKDYTDAKISEVNSVLGNYVNNASVNDIVISAMANSMVINNLRSDLNAEIVRAQVAEKEITDSLEAINIVIESAIEDLNNHIDSCVGDGSGSGNVNLDDYYTKDEVNDVLVTTTNDILSFVYSKTESDEKYQTKGDYATSEDLTEISESLADKADSSTVYNKSESDARYLRSLTMTADEYDALVEADEIDENILYIIL